MQDDDNDYLSMAYEQFLSSCKNHDLATATFLIENNLRIINGKWLNAACEYNFATICLLILSLGISVNFKDENGWTPLLLACENGSWDCITHLMKSDTLDVNVVSIIPPGWTPLHAAVENEYMSIVHYLVSSGAVVDSKDGKGNTPLMLCALNGNTKIARYLYSHGANIDILSEEKRSAIWLGCYNGHLDIISLLIMWGAKFWIRDVDKRTPLHIASYNGHVQVVKFLIHIGASVNVYDAEGDTPLHIALIRGHFSTALELIQGGSGLFDVNYDGQVCHTTMISLYDDAEVRIFMDASNRFQRWVRRKNYLLFLEGYKHSNTREFNFITAEGYSKGKLRICFLICGRKIGRFL